MGSHGPLRVEDRRDGRDRRYNAAFRAGERRPIRKHSPAADGSARHQFGAP
jgi:hypothetical protein